MSQKKRPSTNWLVPTLIFSSVAVLMAVIITMQTGDDDSSANNLTGGSDSSQENPDTGQPDLSEVERRDPDDLLAKGPVDAPVTLVVFSDYQCPYCAKWSHETLPQLEEHANDDDLRIEWRDINVFGDASESASRASYAAALQDEFWEYHDALFPDGESLPENQLTDDALIDLADELGLAIDQFTTDFNSQETIDQIDENAQLGLDYGAASTPVFVLGGQPIIGAQPTEVFLDAYDDALSASED